MCPKTVLISAIEDFEQGDYDNCAEILSLYDNWRNMGGFEPNVWYYGKVTKGDAVYNDLNMRISNCCHLCAV